MQRKLQTWSLKWPCRRRGSPGRRSFALREPNGAKPTQELARRASAAFARAGHELGRLRAKRLLGQALWAAQRHEEAERVCREALAAARRNDLRLVMHELVRALCLILVERGHWAEARLFEEEGLRLAIEEGRPGMVGEGLTSLTIVDALTGNVARAMRRVPAAPPLRPRASFLLHRPVRQPPFSFQPETKRQRLRRLLASAWGKGLG